MCLRNLTDTMRQGTRVCDWMKGEGSGEGGRWGGGEGGGKGEGGGQGGGGVKKRRAPTINKE